MPPQPAATSAAAATQKMAVGRRVAVGGAGAVRIALRNDGDLAHDIHLQRDGEDVGGTPSFPPGDTRSVRLRLQPGTYEMLCTVGDHAQLGMKGELKVR